MSSIPFRMLAGFPGDVSRTHPASVVPAAADSVSPPTEYGIALVVNRATNGLRPVGPADYAGANTAGFLRINGIAVRPFPFQQAAATNYGAASFGGAVPPSVQPLDSMTSGFIMAAVPVGQIPAKDDPVYVWAAATTGQGARVNGDHVQGGFEAVASAGNTVLVQDCHFNGPPDANGVLEVVLRVG